MMAAVLLPSLLLLASAAGAEPDDRPPPLHRPWLDASLSAADRAALILAKMTPPEKLAMLHGNPTGGTECFNKTTGKIIGAYCAYTGNVVGNERLGIPPLCAATRLDSDASRCTHPFATACAVLTGLEWSPSLPPGSGSCMPVPALPPKPVSFALLIRRAALAGAAARRRHLNDGPQGFRENTHPVCPFSHTLKHHKHEPCVSYTIRHRCKHGVKVCLSFGFCPRIWFAGHNHPVPVWPDRRVVMGPHRHGALGKRSTPHGT